MRIAHLGDMADRRAYRASVGPYSTTFIGPAHGMGNVLASLGDGYVHVDSPERFGNLFDRDWITAFYA